jgi:hypothetical protein
MEGRNTCAYSMHSKLALSRRQLSATNFQQKKDFHSRVTTCALSTKEHYKVVIDRCEANIFVQNAIKQQRRKQSGVSRSQLYAAADKAYAAKIRSDPDRYAKHKKMVQQLNQDYAPRLKLMSYTPEYYATHIVENALDKHFSPRFSYLGCADSLEERYASRKALISLHDVLYASGPNCALSPHLPLDRIGGTCFTVSLNRVNNDLNYPPSIVQVTCLASNLTFGNFPNGMAAYFCWC